MAEIQDKKDSKGEFLAEIQVKKDSKGELFAEIREMRCSTRSAPGGNHLQEHMNLSLVPLRMSSVGDIVPSLALFLVKSPIGVCLAAIIYLQTLHGHRDDQIV